MGYNIKVVIAALVIVAAVVSHLLLARMSPGWGLVKLNYRKKEIPASYGIFLACYAAAGCGIAALFTSSSDIKLYLPVMLSMSILGMADDIFGSRDVGGFAGHFKKLFLEGKLTTGAVKALGGGLVSLAAGLYAAGWIVPEGVLNGAVIALSANTLNLLDLRPGRAAGVFLFGLAAAYASAGFSFDNVWPVAAVLVPALVFYRWDAKARAMMGDSGSNLLGAVLGLVFVLETSIMARLVWLAAIVALHVYSERYSITQAIEKHAVLRWIDRRLGER